MRSTRGPAGVKQLKRELELIRSRIGLQRDHVIEHMRDDETRFLEILYSFSESRRLPISAPRRAGPPNG